jgi:haloalkane dehalogenase
MSDAAATPRAAGTTEPTVRPVWLDRTRYPFESRYLTLSEGRVHYIDEGDGPVILMLHGNPTWSFLYRHFVRELSDEYRCVAVDYLGFGLSEKPRDVSYRPADHARLVEKFVAELDLRDVTLVVQDWGGPIGMEYATRHPENVRALVVMNSWMWPAEDRGTKAFSAVLGNRLSKALIERFNLFARGVMPTAYGDRSKLTPEIHRHYLRPLSTPTDRTASWVFPREITGSRGWLANLWDRRDAIRDKPTLLVWGMKDPAFGSALPRWRDLFPNARVVGYDDCGHYVQEEKGPDAAAEIRTFLASIADASTESA